MKKFCLVAIALLAAGNTFAGTQTWSFTNSSDELNYNGFGNSLQLSSGTGGDQVSLTVSAWASTAGSCNPNGGYDFTNTLADADPCIRDANLKKWSSGLGIVNRDEDANHLTAAPQHAIDNIRNGAANEHITNDFDYEMVLLSFSKEVKLSALNVGWSLCGSTCNSGTYNGSTNDGDADISLLAHTGGGNTNFFSPSTEWADITGQGWQLIDNYMDVTDNTSIQTKASGYSKYWLVGAYNRVFGDTMFSIDNDAFKLAGLTTMTNNTSTADPVNAPVTFGLFGLIALGLLYRRKK